MDSLVKLRHTIDALFGSGISRNFPRDIQIEYSKRTGRIRSVYHKERFLCSLRIDGGITLTPYLAQLLLKNKKFRQNCVEIVKDAVPFVREGRSVFCKHVSWCGKNVGISSDTPVLYKDNVIAVGRAVLSARTIPAMKRGVAIKIRDSLKSNSKKRLP
ncbi:MAG: queuine tRNA-ribosyltransferase [Nitrosopumilaceae archaeon]|nr:queuine tRNA-ribosyltransferase [Nitrosopumilaceae archaeon]NIT99939.1 queuine tRNA-ribosyltransferase [Nitrosopumilaceae archaeon]NIU86293.1 queuine tRNA-ribosyltransferase [Nitrosopumilaceae archaeon]NIV65048.1 queuine tRNA-ribosyltransferase [Nitrosopumilaceae archaeon]NIX60542.1 queuine tRNA-ribosyltransferase [Nitrosopumilaceae archaeon]